MSSEFLQRDHGCEIVGSDGEPQASRLSAMSYDVESG
jgi:hypothetical protein